MRLQGGIASLEWLTTSEIAAALDASEPTVRRRASRERWPFEPVPSNGGISHKFYVDQLPGDIRARIFRARAEAEAPAAPDPAQLERSAQLWDHISKTASYRDLETGRRRAGALIDTVLLAEKDRVSFHAAARKVAKEAGFSAVSIHRWHHACRTWPQPDWVALLATRHGGKGCKAEVDQRTWSWFLKDCMDQVEPRLTGSFRRAQRVATANGWGPLPSESTVRRMVAALPEGARVLARKGKQAAAQMHPTQRIDYSGVPSGHYVSADGLKLDSLWVDWGNGRPIQTSTLWVFADAPTGFIMGWDFGPTETTDLVCDALYKLSEGGYLPREIQFDNTRAANGKELSGGAENRNRFNGKAIRRRTDEAAVAREKREAEGLLLALGIVPRFTNPDRVFGNPGSKRVERVFGRGGIHEAIRDDPRLRGKGFSKATAIKGSDLIAVIVEAIREWNDRPNRAIPACAGRSCREAFEESFARHEQRRITAAQRNLLLLRPKRVKVNQRCGEVKIPLGTHEYAKPRYCNPELENHRGRYVDVWFNPRDLEADVTVRSVEGRFICVATHNGDTVFRDREAAREHARSKRRGLKAKQAQLDEIGRMDMAEYQAAWRVALDAEAEAAPAEARLIAVDSSIPKAVDGVVDPPAGSAAPDSEAAAAGSAPVPHGGIPLQSEESFRYGLAILERKRKQQERGTDE